MVHYTEDTDISILNENDTIMIKGDINNPDSDSRRYALNDNGEAIIQRYDEDTKQWVSASLEVASASIQVGKQTTLSDTGNKLAFSNKKTPNVFYISPTYGFSESIPISLHNSSLESKKLFLKW